jgi:hypothetical protein
MKRNAFLFETQINFAIASDDATIDPQSITELLQLSPNRVHKKGDTWTSKHSGSLCTKPRTVWAIDSESTIREDESISHHIEYFKSILLRKADILKKYKEDGRYELSFWVTIKTNYGGAGIDLAEEELNFFNEFSNRFVVSVSSGRDTL